MNRQAAGWWILVVATTVLLCALPARADEPRGLELRWSAPAGCPEKQQVLEEITRLLGSERALREGGPLLASGTIERFARGFRLKLVFPSASSEITRNVESETCGELDEAAGLILALSLDPNNPRLATAALPASVAVGTDAEPRTEPAETGPPPAPPPAPPAPPPESQAAATKDPPASRESFGLDRPSAGARVALDFGTLPSVAIGGLLDGSLPFGPVAVGLELSLFAPQTHTIDGAGGTFVLSAVSLLPCWPLRFGRLLVAPCGSLEADFIFASGRGVEEPEQPFTWFPRLGLGAELGYAVSSRVRLGAGLFGLVTPARPRFVVQDDQELFRPAVVGARVSAGLEFAF